MSAYAKLEDRLRRISALYGAASILNWDRSVIMPTGAADIRGEQLAVLAGLQRDLMAAGDVADWIDEATGEELDDWQRANLREARRQHRLASSVPLDLVEAIAQATGACEMTWREARREGDFARLRPYAEEVVRLVRRQAVLLGDAIGAEPYDALLEQHQPGLRQAVIDPVVDSLVTMLPRLLDRARARARPALVPKGPFPIDRQRALTRSLMERLGFDFGRGRLDESAHPFCGGVGGDLRVTTRYRADELVSGIMAALHETGHALYEDNLPETYRAQCVGESRGMTVHESQALVFERHACREPSFLGFLSACLTDVFGADPAFEPDNLVRLCHRLEPGAIRVTADEIGYPLHVVVRYRLERALIAGALEVRDLPEAWNEGMRDLVGVCPGSDRDGVLQDIHWYIGFFGYFPNYAMGAILAAQMYEAARHALPDLDTGLANGDFTALRLWLKENVHDRASLLELPDLIERATGKPLAVDDFLTHLHRRYDVALRSTT